VARGYNCDIVSHISNRIAMAAVPPTIRISAPHLAETRVNQLDPSGALGFGYCLIIFVVFPNLVVKIGGRLGGALFPLFWSNAG
jgi:hypothetical protein